MNALMAEDGRVRAIWRFLGGALFAFIAYFVAIAITVQFSPHPGLPFDFLFRPVWMVLLLLGFSFLLITSDGAPRPLPAMGLGLPWAQDTVVGLLIGAGMVVIAGASIVVGAELQLRAVLSMRTLVRIVPVVVVIASGAMAEELAFRGYPFQRLIESTGKWPAVLIMSGLFGSVHLRNPDASLLGFINTVLVGALFCLAYLRTWSLWLPFGLHVGWNATLGLILGLPVSGLREFAVVVRGSTRNAVWLTGGTYGIEAGLAGTLAIGLGFLALVAFVPKVPPPRQVELEPASLGLLPPDAPLGDTREVGEQGSDTANQQPQKSEIPE